MLKASAEQPPVHCCCCLEDFCCRKTRCLESFGYLSVSPIISRDLSSSLGKNWLPQIVNLFSQPTVQCLLVEFKCIYYFICLITFLRVGNTQRLLRQRRMYSPTPWLLKELWITLVSITTSSNISGKRPSSCVFLTRLNRHLCSLAVTWHYSKWSTAVDLIFHMATKFLSAHYWRCILSALLSPAGCLTSTSAGVILKIPPSYKLALALYRGSFFPFKGTFSCLSIQDSQASRKLVCGCQLPTLSKVK